MNGPVPLAYSRLPDVLEKSRLKITDLQKRLLKAGVYVNSKSLYRLTSNTPLQKVDTRILGAICQACDVQIQDVIGFERPRVKLRKLTRAQQKRLDVLMDERQDRQLTRQENQEYESLCDLAHELTMANARALAAQRRSLKFAGRDRRKLKLQ